MVLLAFALILVGGTLWGLHRLREVSWARKFAREIGKSHARVAYTVILGEIDQGGDIFPKKIRLVVTTSDQEWSVVGELVLATGVLFGNYVFLEEVRLGCLPAVRQSLFKGFTEGVNSGGKQLRNFLPPRIGRAAAILISEFGYREVREGHTLLLTPQ